MFVALLQARVLGEKLQKTPAFNIFGNLIIQQI